MTCNLLASCSELLNESAHQALSNKHGVERRPEKAFSRPRCYCCLSLCQARLMPARYRGPSAFAQLEQWFRGGDDRGQQNRGQGSKRKRRPQRHTQREIGVAVACLLLRCKLDLTHGRLECSILLRRKRDLVISLPRYKKFVRPSEPNATRRVKKPPSFRIMPDERKSYAHLH